MKVVTFITSPLQTNTYLAINEKLNKAFVVDIGGDEGQILKVIDDNKLDIEAILLTHGHFDHIGGVAALKRGLEKRGMSPSIFIHKDDSDKIGTYKNLAFSMGCSIEKFAPDVLLLGNENLNIAGLDIEVIHTPGHSKGGVCYKVEDSIFVGDTIFYSSYGRYDFYDGDFKELKNSIINKVFKIDGDYKLYTGHGNETSLAFEKLHNMILFDEESINIVD